MITQANGQVQRLGIELKKVSNFHQQSISIYSLHTQIGYKADEQEGEDDEKDGGKMDLTMLKARSTDILKQLKRNIVSEITIAAWGLM